MEIEIDNMRYSQMIRCKNYKYFILDIEAHRIKLHGDFGRYIDILWDCEGIDYLIEFLRSSREHVKAIQEKLRKLEEKEENES